MPRITPNLWFDSNGEEAAEFYVSVFPNSKITNILRYGEAGPGKAGSVMTVDFVLDGQEHTVINGGPEFTFSEAVSLLVDCADQEEVDYYWAKLSEGGQEGPCGWLKDKYGLSWQVFPSRAVADTLGSADPKRQARAMAEMMRQTKIDVAAIRAAADRVED
jgi:predicted 3-demethylubiquinone-9 3-methyltransferase (glyoxalase superfamily)